jgi:hypothetical protein
MRVDKHPQSGDYTAPGDEEAMSRELDEQCARALGWHKGRGGAITTPKSESRAYWYDAHGGIQEPCVTDGFANLRAFSPSMIHEDTCLLEDEIERRGLDNEYMQALLRIVAPSVDWAMRSWDIIWRCYRATPEQKARAFLEAINGPQVES